MDDYQLGKYSWVSVGHSLGRHIVGDVKGHPTAKGQTLSWDRQGLDDNDDHNSVNVPTFRLAQWYRGRLGMWDAKLCRGPKPRAVMGHVHWIQTACDFHASSIKTIPIMAAWRFNWTAAHAVHGENVYFASSHREGAGSGQASVRVEKVLVLAPSIAFEMGGLPGFGPHYLKVCLNTTN